MKRTAVRLIVLLVSRGRRLKHVLGMFVVLGFIAGASPAGAENPPCPLDAKGNVKLIVNEERCNEIARCGGEYKLVAVVCTVPSNKSTWSYQECRQVRPCKKCLPRPSSVGETKTLLKDQAKQYLRDELKALASASKQSCTGAFTTQDFESALGMIDRTTFTPEEQWAATCAQYFEGNALSVCSNHETKGFTNVSGVFIRAGQGGSLSDRFIDEVQDDVVHEGIHAIFQSRRQRQHQLVSAKNAECEDGMIDAYLKAHSRKMEFCPQN